MMARRVRLSDAAGSVSSGVLQSVCPQHPFHITKRARSSLLAGVEVEAGQAAALQQLQQAVIDADGKLQLDMAHVLARHAAFEQRPQRIARILFAGQVDGVPQRGVLRRVRPFLCKMQVPGCMCDYVSAWCRLVALDKSQMLAACWRQARWLQEAHTPPMHEPFKTQASGCMAGMPCRRGRQRHARAG